MVAAHEWRATGLFAGRALGAAVDVVADTHRAIGNRVGTFLPPVARAVNKWQLRYAEGVYSTVATAHRLAPRLAAEGAARSSVAPTQTRAGRTLAPVLNGLKGDLVAQDHPELAIPMSVRLNGEDVPPSSIAEIYAGATANVVVFVHGLAEDEQAWFLAEPGYSFPERLAKDSEVTPVLVRYNSGLRISDNGLRLATLLDDLVGHWPVTVRSITLVGHSMGGLVIRSACQQGRDADLTWVGRTSTVITLGTPHTGAPLEKAVNVVDWVMRRVPEAEPIGRILAERAVGVKDLRFGSLLPSDWQGHDPDELLRNTRGDVPLLPHVRYRWIAGSLTENPAHPLSRMIGDGMVRLPSASAVGDTGVQVSATGHMKLLASDEVYQRLLEWVGSAR